MISIALLTILSAGEIHIERGPDLYVAPRVNEMSIDVPPDTDPEIKRRLRALDYLPDLFQVQLDGLKRFHSRDIDRAMEAGRVQYLLEMELMKKECNPIKIGVYLDWKVLIPIAILLAGGSAYVGWRIGDR